MVNNTMQVDSTTQGKPKVSSFLISFVGVWGEDGKVMWRYNNSN